MCYQIFLLLLLGSTFTSIRADDDKFEMEINDVGTGDAAVTPAPVPELAPEVQMQTYLKSLNDKLDRLEEAVELLRVNISKPCDNTEVIRAIKESQTSLETGVFNLEEVLLKNREMVCDSTQCEKKPPPPPEISKDEPIRDCCAVQRAGSTDNGLYTVYPYASNTTRGVQVYCDLKTKGGGWTVIQRREETKGPTENFQRHWAEYEAGFGNKETTFWQGLPDIAALTEDNDQAVRFDMMDWEGVSRYAEYEKFFVAGASDLYRLTVTGYSGTAGNSFGPHSGNPFTTLDQDNNIYTRKCADNYKGGWWYISCHYVNPNGLYVVNGTPSPWGTGINWYAFKYYYYSLKRIDMKLRNRRYANGCLP